MDPSAFACSTSISFGVGGSGQEALRGEGSCLAPLGPLPTLDLLCHPAPAFKMRFPAAVGYARPSGNEAGAGRDPSGAVSPPAAREWLRSAAEMWDLQWVE